MEVHDEDVMEIVYEFKAQWLGSASTEDEYERIKAFDVNEIKRTLTVIASLRVRCHRLEAETPPLLCHVATALDEGLPATNRSSTAGGKRRERLNTSCSAPCRRAIPPPHRMSKCPCLPSLRIRTTMAESKFCQAHYIPPAKGRGACNTPARGRHATRSREQRLLPARRPGASGCQP